MRKSFSGIMVFIPALLIASSASAQSVAGDTTEDKIFTVVEIPPTYPGGVDAMKKFIKSNLQYPKKARRKKLEGKVFVQFMVETDGSLTSIETLKGIDPEIDKEAARIVSIMPTWRPGKKNGKPSRTRYVMPVEFGLEPK